MIKVQPLTQMLEMYCDNYDTLRDENLDLQPMMFHKNYGLSIRVPQSWDILSSIAHLVDRLALDSKKVVVIFGSTDSYRKMYDALKDKVRYFSWHEVFTGMHTSSTDVRYIKKSKQLLSDASVTFFVDPPPMSEVMDQICGQTTNCLIVLSGGGV